MNLPNYDEWKLRAPIDAVVAKCTQCERELFNDQDVLYDSEFELHFCNEDCLKVHVIAHIDDYLDIVKEHTTEQIQLEKQKTRHRAG